MDRASVVMIAGLLALLLGCEGPSEQDDEASSESDVGSEADSESSSDSDSGSSSGSTSDSESSSSSESTDESESSSDSDTGTGSPGCGQPSPGPGTHTDGSVDVDGVTREYELFVPSSYDSNEAAPLVLNFHGLLGTPGQQADWSQFDATAQRRGMLVAYPAGIGNSFNAGQCCGTAFDQGVDDVGFARALVEQLSADFCIDPKRVFVTGMSNGGHMAHLLACEAADMFAAAASVTGVLGLAPANCQPSRPVSMLDFHGTSDLIVSYDGAGPGYPPVETMMQDWAVRNGCSPLAEVSLEVDDVTCVTWPGCDDDVEVTLCTIAGGGHCWPGNGSCLFGYSTTAVHASEMIADMFEANPMP